LLSGDDEVRLARGFIDRLATALVASALSISSAILLAAGSAPRLHGERIVNVLGAIGLFFGVLLMVRLLVQMLREGDS
jgi:hypothetical protein